MDVKIPDPNREGLEKIAGNPALCEPLMAELKRLTAKGIRKLRHGCKTIEEYERANGYIDAVESLAKRFTALMKGEKDA